MKYFILLHFIILLSCLELNAQALNISTGCGTNGQLLDVGARDPRWYYVNNNQLISALVVSTMDIFRELVTVVFQKDISLLQTVALMRICHLLLHIFLEDALG